MTVSCHSFPVTNRMSYRFSDQTLLALAHPAVSTLVRQSLHTMSQWLDVSAPVVASAPVAAPSVDASSVAVSSVVGSGGSRVPSGVAVPVGRDVVGRRREQCRRSDRRVHRRRSQCRRSQCRRRRSLCRRSGAMCADESGSSCFSGVWASTAPDAWIGLRWQTHRIACGRDGGCCANGGSDARSSWRNGG